MDISTQDIWTLFMSLGSKSKMESQEWPPLEKEAHLISVNTSLLFLNNSDSDFGFMFGIQKKSTALRVIDANGDGQVTLVPGSIMF